jgi:hypothetical protein
MASKGTSRGDRFEYDFRRRSTSGAIQPAAIRLGAAPLIEDAPPARGESGRLGEFLTGLGKHFRVG